MIISDPVITELIAINYAKRELKILPDKWYHLDAQVVEHARLDLLPDQPTINTANLQAIQ